MQCNDENFAVLANVWVCVDGQQNKCSLASQVTQRKASSSTAVFCLYQCVLCEYKKKVPSSHRSSCPPPGVLLLEVPGANICRDRRFVTGTQWAPLLLLWWFFSLSKAGVWGLAPPPVLHGLWVSGGAPPALRNRPAALRRLAGPPPLRLRLAGGAPPLPAFLPCFLPLGLVVGWAGAFPFLLVRGGAVACLLLLLRWGRATVIPRADLYHQGGRLQKAPRGLGVVRVEPLGFAVSWRDAFLTPDPVWGDGIWISRQHGLLVKLPGADVRLERERWPGWPRFPRFPSVLPLSSFIFGASSVGGRLACFLPLVGAAPFADSRAAAASAAAGGFSRSDGNMLLGLSFRRSLRFFQLPGTNLGHIVEVPAGFGANGRLASAYLFKSSGKKL